MVYHVYITRTAGMTQADLATYAAEEGDYTDAHGWIHFICRQVGDQIISQNIVAHSPSHVSYSLRVGQVVNKIQLIGCTVPDTDDNTTVSNNYNDIKEFMVRSILSGSNMGYDIYLHIYEPSEDDDNYIKYVDNSETWQDYCHVVLTGMNFKLDNSGVYVGTMTFDECWD